MAKGKRVRSIATATTANNGTRGGNVRRARQRARASRAPQAAGAIPTPPTSASVQAESARSGGSLQAIAAARQTTRDRAVQRDEAVQPAKAARPPRGAAKGAATTAVPKAAATTVSGRYRPVATGSVPAAPGSPATVTSERLALDVDDYYPQRVVSGTVRSGLSRRTHWIARLTADGPSQFHGPVFFRDGSAELFPFSAVAIEVLATTSSGERRVRATFSGGGVSRSREFRRSARSFHSASFEFDRVASVSPVAAIDTAAHPHRPATLPAETLSIREVFQRAGFYASTSSAGNIVPVSGAGTDLRWSDREMHDAMQAHWSRFADEPQWALWVFYAALHVEGTSLGGIMFDDVGPNHRQGTAIFCNSFIAQAPSGDPAPQAWRNRMQFWTACHEMGHAFNLAHSWDKAEPPSWIPLVSRPESRSFMNYPYEVQGGQSRFFRDFRFRFDDDELLFMRHAPEAFVQMGNADWFDQHAFRNADLPEVPAFRLELRHHRVTDAYEFLEPMMIELKLTNIGRKAVHVPASVLAEHSRLVVIIKPDGRPARQYIPYARYCREPGRTTLKPGQSLYEILFAGADRTGWLAGEPGAYTLQALAEVNGEDVISNELRVKIAPPRSFDEERFGQDYFTPDVGRVLAFDGSHVLAGACAALEELVGKPTLSSCRAAVHAGVALGLTRAGDQKLLAPAERASAPARLQQVKGRPGEARALLDTALRKSPQRAAESLGNIDFNYYSQLFAAWLLSQGERRAAETVVASAVKTLTQRKVIPAAIAELRGTLKGS